MPEHLRSAVAGTTALLVCAVSSVNAYASAPLLRAHARLQALPVRAARRVAPVGPSMVHTPSRIDENDAVAVANLKRSLDRLVELPSAEPSDHVVSAPVLCPPHFGQPRMRLLCWRPWCHCAVSVTNAPEPGAHGHPIGVRVHGAPAALLSLRGQ